MGFVGRVAAESLHREFELSPQAASAKDRIEQVRADRFFCLPRVPQGLHPGLSRLTPSDFAKH